MKMKQFKYLKYFPWDKLIIVLVFCGLSIGIGYYSAVITFSRAQGYELGRWISTILILLFCLIFSYFLQILTHEVGHLTMGMVMGYRLVAVYIGGIRIVKEEGKLAIKGRHFAKKGGVCQMTPPENTSNTYRDIMYHLGGVLANALVSGISLMLGYRQSFPGIQSGFCLFISIFGILLILLRGIPMKIGGEVNDGYHVFFLREQDIEKEDIEKADIEKADIEKADIEKADIEKADIELIMMEDMKQTLEATKNELPESVIEKVEANG